MYLASQVCAALSTVILLVYSVLKVKRGTILICNVVINLLLAIHYVLLNSMSGAVCSAMTALMAYVFSLRDSSRFPVFSLSAVPAFFGAAFCAAGFLTWQDGWSLIPVIGNMILVLALWNRKPNVTKGLFIIVGLLWIVLNIHLRSYANIIGQILSVTSNVIYFIRIRRDKKAAVQ